MLYTNICIMNLKEKNYVRQPFEEYRHVLCQMPTQSKHQQPERINLEIK